MASRRFRTFAAATFVVLGASLMAVVPAQAAPGDLDTTFSGDGRQITDFGANDVAADLAVQPDGKLVVVGGSGGDFAIARYKPDGSLDGSFSADGKQAADLGSTSDEAAGLALQADGKIVVVGETGAGAGPGDFAVVRYNPDGSLDTTFSGDGTQTTDFGGSIDVAADVALQPDGKIVAVGYARGEAYDFALVRYNTDGSLDPTFSVDGRLVTDFGRDDASSAVALQADGSIVAVGRSGTDFDGGYDFAVARYSADGSLDASFSAGGRLVTDFGGDDAASDVVVQPDGSIMAAGYALGGAYDFGLARYDPDGSLDTSFSGDGRQTTHFNANDGAWGMALQTDGKIVVAGHAGVGVWQDDFALARYNPDGSLDNTFSGDGQQTTDFGYDNDAFAVALQGDGKLVAAGITGPISGGRDFALARYDGGDGAGTAPTSLSAPTISGSAIEGQTLTVSPGTWSGSTPITLTYEWRRCDSAGAGCLDIAGATGTTYTLTSADVGRTIRVRETATNAYGSASADSAAPPVVKSRLGAIAGTVRSASNGAPLANASVSCTGGYSAKTSSSGTYSIPKVAPGRYTCTASAKRHAPSTQAVTVLSGETATANFNLARR
jgi:uncharacterized delta-60 repeat protein